MQHIREPLERRSVGSAVLFQYRYRHVSIEPSEARAELMKKHKVILLAHFEPDGGLAEDWRKLLELLRAAGFADLVLVSTGLDTARHRDALEGIRVIVRENVGYDFYSWRHAIAATNLGDYDEAILLNNSFHVVDPEKFCRVLATPLPADTHVRGLTCSWEIAHHAQSYFLQFSQTAVKSAAFESFWKNMQPMSERAAVIEKYEIGLSRELSRHFRIDSIFRLGPYEKYLIMRRGLKNSSWVNAATLDAGYEAAKGAFNPSLMLWDCLLPLYGIVKKQLVHENPLKWPIDDITGFVATCMGSPPPGRRE
jgi:Rhamnan synthesis protein F